MATPRYVVKRIGDRYVTIRQDPYAKVTRGVYVGWGGLLLLLGKERRGVVRTGLWLSGLGLIVRGACGCDWLAGASAWWRSHVRRDGRGSEAPSYQNDARGRARQMPADLLDEQLMESFPASDPPARTSVA